MEEDSTVFLASSKVSLSTVRLAVSISALTRTTARPVPSSWSNIVVARVSSAVSSSVRALAARSLPAPVPSVVSRRPLLSVTLTSDAARSGTELATRWVIASMASSSREPSLVTSTEARAGSRSSVNSFFSGSARWTSALRTPSMAPTVEDSVDSMARW